MFSDFGLSVVTAASVASDALSDRSNEVQRQFKPSVHAGTLLVPVSTHPAGAVFPTGMHFAPDQPEL